MRTRSRSPHHVLPPDHVGVTDDVVCHHIGVPHDVRRVADEADVLFLAQAHFAEPVGHLGRGGVFLDADGDPGLHMAQRTGVRVGAMPLDDHDFFGFLSHR